MMILPEQCDKSYVLFLLLLLLFLFVCLFVSFLGEWVAIFCLVFRFKFRKLQVFSQLVIFTS